MTQEISASVPVRPARDALTGQAALITGAARRVGASIARMLHAAGADVVLHYRSSADDAAALARELNDSRPGSAALAECDLLQLAQLPGLVAGAISAFGGLDILVNNASTFYPTPLGDIGEIDWDDLVGTNLKAPLFLAQAAAPALHERRGLIINVTDIHGLRPLRRYPVYSLAKAGLIMLTKSLARELGPHVRVNAVAPGPVMWAEDAPDPALQLQPRFIALETPVQQQVQVHRARRPARRPARPPAARLDRLQPREHLTHRQRGVEAGHQIDEVITLEPHGAIAVPGREACTGKLARELGHRPREVAFGRDIAAGGDIDFGHRVRSGPRRGRRRSQGRRAHARSPRRRRASCGWRRAC